MCNKLKVLLVVLLLLVLFGCSNKKTYSANDIADSIADISSDADGNVIINLVNGKTFSLGNLKGKDGVDGKNGLNGKDGIDGKNGLNGKDGKNGLDGKDGYVPTNYIKTLSFEGEKLTAEQANGTKKYIGSVYTHGQYYYEIDCIYYDAFDTNDPKKVIGTYFGYADEGEDVVVLLDEIIDYYEDGDYGYGYGFLCELDETISPSLSFTMPARDIVKEITYKPHMCEYTITDFCDSSYYLTNYKNIYGYQIIGINIPKYYYVCKCGNSYEQYLMYDEEHCEHHDFTNNIFYLEGGEKYIGVCECGQYIIDNVDKNEIVTFTVPEDGYICDQIGIDFYSWTEDLADINHPAGSMEIYDSDGNYYEIGQTYSLTREQVLNRKFFIKQYLSQEDLPGGWNIEVESPEASHHYGSDYYDFDENVQLKLHTTNMNTDNISNFKWFIDWDRTTGFATITEDGLLKLHEDIPYSKYYCDDGKFEDEHGKYNRQYLDECRVSVCCEFDYNDNNAMHHCGASIDIIFGED